MSYPITQLLALVNRDNTASLATALTDTQVTVNAAAVNTDSAIARDTVVTIDSIPGKGYRGSVTVYYNRIDLGVLFLNVGANVGLTVVDGDTSDKLIPLLNAKYGTHFEVGDLVAQPLEVSTDIKEVVLAAAGGNVMYTGQFTVKYGLEETALDSVVLTTTLSGFNYPSSDLTKGQAAIYSYNLDGSAEPSNFWATVNVGPVTAGFVTPFNTAFRVDEDWVYDAATGNYNLYGASVVYAGVNDAALLPQGVDVALNPLYNNVVVMQLGAECANFAGYLTVYFGGSKV